MSDTLTLALTVTSDIRHGEDGTVYTIREDPWNVVDRLVCAVSRILPGHGSVIAECVESMGPFEESPERYHFYGDEMALKLFYGLMVREQPSCADGLTFEEIVGIDDIPSPSAFSLNGVLSFVPGECF